MNRRRLYGVCKVSASQKLHLSLRTEVISTLKELFAVIIVYEVFVNWSRRNGRSHRC
ncbi:hypothetical protein QWZ13_14525 [Reinekea marina]|uniref:hypothetical protein n=1 Tax=Reinekea marina TaxID=1310421 RepID=UPI0025B4C615|nr:hypothetical protein [Reinekea marina]MDN3650132.1 hypothetical protein [Reinekea marina]